MVLTEIERQQIAWFKNEGGFSTSEVAIMYDVGQLTVLAAAREFKDLYE